jgi:Flp pilus assembly pilin Flp
VKPLCGAEVAKLLREEPGQATAEYAVLVTLTVAVCIASAKGLEVAIWYYYQDLVSLICLPIP